MLHSQSVAVSRVYGKSFRDFPIMDSRSDCQTHDRVGLYAARASCGSPTAAESCSAAASPPSSFSSSSSAAASAFGPSSPTPTAAMGSSTSLSSSSRPPTLSKHHVFHLLGVVGSLAGGVALYNYYCGNLEQF